MPNLTINTLTGAIVPLSELYGEVKPNIPLVVFRSIPGILSSPELMRRWAAGEISIVFEYLDYELTALGQLPARQEVGTWGRDDVAAGLVDSPMLPPEIASVAFAERLMIGGGSVVGMKAQLSEAPAGSALTFTVSKNGVATAADMVIAIAGPLNSIFMFATPVDYSAGDTLGVKVSTGGGWTSVNLDALVGLLVIENAPL